MEASSKLLYKACFYIIFLLLVNGGIAAYGQPADVPAPASSMPPAYEITSDTAAFVTLPGSGWQLMADPDGKLTFAQVLQANRFQDTNRKVNYKYHVYWLRYRLVNKMPGEAKIAFPVTAAYADLYTKTDSGDWKHARTGTMVRWSERDGLKRIPAFTVAIPAGKELQVYKRVYWNYVAAQPDSMAAGFSYTEKLIQQNYIHDESGFMHSMEDAFILGLFVLSMIISFYFFLVVHEKEFLYFSLYLLLACLYSIPSLKDVFLREYPYLLSYMYIVGNSLSAFGLIHFLRLFLKTFKRFPRWDKVLVVFSFLLVMVLASSHFVSTVFHTNLTALSHFSYNFFMLVSGVIVLITLFLYVREHDRVIRLMIIALTPILCLKVIAYLEFVIYGLYSSRFGAPAVSGYANSFNKVAFFIFILSYLWMMVFFNWVLFLRFYRILKKFNQQRGLNRLKSRFFANISHEFRTPLTLIIGPIEDLLRDGDAARFKSILPEVHRNSKRLLQLINQLLDLSRFDAGNYRINTTRDDVIPFVKQIVHAFHSLAERKNIYLEMEVDPRLKDALSTRDLHFYFDDDILEKILSNLLSNAFKFTPEGGAITVSLELPAEKQFLLLRVADNGTGIPAEKLPYIFDRFYQADDSNKKQHGGSGIGLALLKELVELHNGHISVSSKVNKGTAFYCYLPFNKKMVSNSQGVPDTQGADIPATPAEDQDVFVEEDNNTAAGDEAVVLIVEDQEDVRKYIRKKLEGTYSIMEAQNGNEGLETAIKEIPDLVISDVMMPEMDGFELCERLKTDDRTSHIPVILLTARAEDSDKMTGLETGADVYLIKPFNSHELSIRVNNLIQVRKKMRVKFSNQLVVKPSEISITSHDRLFMEKALSVVESRLSDSGFSVDQLADEMNMSTSQMNRKLKAIINQTTQRFIRSIRMQRALEFLKEEDASVSEAAWKTGFEDPGYFAKVFKQQFGCLPSEKEKFP